MLTSEKQLCMSPMHFYIRHWPDPNLQCTHRRKGPGKKEWETNPPTIANRGFAQKRNPERWGFSNIEKGRTHDYMEKGMQSWKKGPSNSVEKCSLKILERKSLSEREKSLDKKSLYIRKHRAIEERRKGPSLGQKRNLYKGEKDPLKGIKGPAMRDIREKKASNERDKGPQ